MIKKYQRTANMFDGTYIKGYISSNFVYRVQSASQNPYDVSIVISVNPNTTYTIKKFDTSDRLRIGGSEVEPVNNAQLTTINNDMSLTQYTFTTGNNIHYIVVYLSSDSEMAEPRVMLVEGSTAPSTYQAYYDWQEVGYKKYETATDTFTTLPHEVIGDGQSNLTWSMKGNMQQSGTPTPSNPVYPVETGEKTANLFDYKTAYSAYLQPNGDVTAPASYFNNTVHNSLANFIGQEITISVNCVTINSSTVKFKVIINGSEVTGEIKNRGYTGIMSFTVTPQTVDDWWSISYGTVGTDTYNQFMINTGSTALPYEPYGYKIPISFGQGNYISYLSEPIRKIETADEMASTGTATRNIKKMVLTGNEAFWGTDGTLGSLSRYTILPTGADTIMRGSRVNAYCSHYIADADHATNTIYVYSGSTGVYMYFYVPTADYPTLADYKSYVQQQYANGTPITLWYVLATPTTETFTAPSIPTSGSPQSFDVDTTLKPSEVSLTYHGWHEHSDEKYVGGVTANKIQSAAAGTYTDNGITVTSDGQGRYHISGTNTENANITLSIPEITFTTNVNVGLFNTISSQRVTVGFGYNGTTYQAWYISPENRVINNSYNMKNLPINEIIIGAMPTTVDCDVSPYMNLVSVTVPDHYIPYGGQWEIENP